MQGRIDPYLCGTALDMRLLLLTMWKYEYGGGLEHVSQRGIAVRLRTKKLCTKRVLYEGSLPVTNGVLAFGAFKNEGLGFSSTH